MVRQFVGLQKDADRLFQPPRMNSAFNAFPDPNKRDWKTILLLVMSVVSIILILGSFSFKTVIENLQTLKGQYEHSADASSPVAMADENGHQQMIEEMLEEMRKAKKEGVWKFVEEDDDGNPRFNKWAERMLNDVTNKLNNYEQYVIFADKDGWYPCRGCKPPGYTTPTVNPKWFTTYISAKPRNFHTIYLKKGMILKYGVRIQGEQRYPKIFEYLCDCTVETERTGTETEMKIEEFKKSMRYIYRPENWTRPPGQRLTSPPWQAGFR